MTTIKQADIHTGEWRMALADDGSGDWREKWFLDGDTAAVENTPQGMILRAGPDIKDNGDSMVLWTRDSFVGDVKIEYEFTRHDRAVEGVNIIYLKATGIGEAPHEKDIFAWKELRNRARMPLYFNYMNALHISYSVGLPDMEGEYIRARRYPAPVGVPFQTVTEVEGTHWGTGLFKLDVPYRLTVVSVGNVLAFDVCGDGRNEHFEWDVSKFPPLSEGRIGLRVMPCRISRIRDFKVYAR
jgi:hypothetical protein